MSAADEKYCIARFSFKFFLSLLNTSRIFLLFFNFPFIHKRHVEEAFSMQHQRNLFNYFKLPTLLLLRLLSVDMMRIFLLLNEMHNRNYVACRKTFPSLLFIVHFLIVVSSLFYFLFFDRQLYVLANIQMVVLSFF